MRTSQRLLPWLLLAVVWFGAMCSRPLFEPDEGRYAEIPREMIALGDWVTPHLNGLVYFEKPPLQYWITAAMYSLFGLHEWSARFWAVTTSFLCLPMVFIASKRLYGSRESGAAAAAVLASSPYFVLVGQLNLLDGAFTTLLTAALFAFIAAQRAADARGSRRAMMMAWGAIALAVLSKGVVALLLTSGTLLVYTAIMRDGSPWRRMQWWPGLALLATIVVPWFWLVSSRNPDFLQFFFIREHVMRFLTTVHDRVQPWWYFLPITLLALAPWAGRLGSAVRAAWRDDSAEAAFQPKRFLLVWSAVVISFFSASGSKLAPYVLPCMPALAVLLAPQIVGYARAARTAAVTTLILVSVVGLGLIAASRFGSLGMIPIGLIAWVGAAVVSATALLLWLRRPGFDQLGGFGVVAAAGSFAWIALLMAYTMLPAGRSAKTLTAQIRPHISPTIPLYAVGQYRQSVPPYLGRTLRIAAYEGELAFGLKRSAQPRLPTLEAFERQWRSESEGIAFMSAADFIALRARGIPGRILASDAESVVVTRQ